MYWENLTTKSFQEQVLGQINTALLPVGSVEAHGQHCPLGTDNLAPTYFCRQLEERYPDRVLVLPAIPYGHTWDLAGFAGTLSIGAETLTHYVRDVGRAVGRWGITRLVVVNGHGGNIGPITAAMEDIADDGVLVVLVNWWLDFSADILTVVQSQGHAGEDETSVMLAIAGPLVNQADASFNPYRPRYRMKGRGLEQQLLRHATTGDGRSATREKGEEIVERVMQRLSQLLEDLWADRLFDRI
ncbi:creatininase subfamily protein [Sulfobacillus acidophilus TPY]|uniref:Creatininase n=1 Tax=Sulfobacillus acidophilus (strain ATCC 700253 / DSM 10332 / NAL) TaxID=679936 RepID=G8TXM3_SULAD|nr:creatininase subfamily protein [Sulfobacillus acidophilus TPY]AEW04979.1 Creatininase [Sulfobacillus acidophilus DSM 10332]